ncbi:hypothetical protein BJX63DRAFT_230229 [Aspergillus granulosus]|uniref:Myb-like domain-containing protein n=1 Tax=Aspergillus granulosus TaxID=176169 RepID=A0ABR4HD22_9EURO
MLLPSALSCDPRRPSRFTPMRLFSTPPPSADDSGLPSNGLLGTCRALQSLLGSPAPSPRQTKPARLQSPLNFRPTPPSPATSSRQTRSASKLAAKPRSPRPSRGLNKRRRNTYEEDMEMDLDTTPTPYSAEPPSNPSNPSTPKRRRHLPYDLPLGLSQTDFYSLHSPPVTQSPPSPEKRRQHDELPDLPLFNPDAALPSIEEPTEPTPPADDMSWSADDDQRLVEMVLEKFQLSKRDWDECARRMGKDHASVGQRWQALVGEGNVGLRRGKRMVRSRIHKDWM